MLNNTLIPLTHNALLYARCPENTPTAVPCHSAAPIILDITTRWELGMTTNLVFAGHVLAPTDFRIEAL